jgi:hypothetical protein
MHALIRSGVLKNQCIEVVIQDLAHDKNFKWIEKDEFRYKGCMYDVISVVIKGNSATFQCISDSREEQLIARHDQFNHLLASTSTPDRSRNVLTLQQLLVHQALVGEILLKAPSDYTVFQYHHTVSELKTLPVVPKSPPPRFS